MKKYIIAGAIGFLIHAAWIIAGAILFNYNSFLNIARYYGENIDQKSILEAFVNALLISIIFLGIVRILLIRSKYDTRERWFLSLATGVGFHAVFWALVFVFRLTFSGFWN